MTFTVKYLVFLSLLLFSTTIYAQYDNYYNSAGSKVTYGQYFLEKNASQPNSPSHRYAPLSGRNVPIIFTKEEEAINASWRRLTGRRTPEEIAKEQAQRKADAEADKKWLIAYQAEQATLNENIYREKDKVSTAINKYWIDVDFSIFKKLDAGTCINGNCKVRRNAGNCYVKSS